MASSNNNNKTQSPSSSCRHCHASDRVRACKCPGSTSYTTGYSFDDSTTTATELQSLKEEDYNEEMDEPDEYGCLKYPKARAMREADLLEMLDRFLHEVRWMPTAEFDASTTPKIESLVFCGSNSDRLIGRNVRASSASARARSVELGCRVEGTVIWYWTHEPEVRIELRGATEATGAVATASPTSARTPPASTS